MQLGNFNSNIIKVLQTCTNRAQSLLEQCAFLSNIDISYLSLDDTILPYRLTSVVSDLIKFVNGTADPFDSRVIRYIAGVSSYNDAEFFNMVEYIKFILCHDISIKKLSDYLNHCLRIELNDRSCDNALSKHISYVCNLKQYQTMNNDIITQNIILTRTYKSHQKIFDMLVCPNNLERYKKDNNLFFDD